PYTRSSDLQCGQRINKSKMFIRLSVKKRIVITAHCRHNARFRNKRNITIYVLQATSFKRTWCAAKWERSVIKNYPITELVLKESRRFYAGFFTLTIYL